MTGILAQRNGYHPDDPGPQEPQDVDAYHGGTKTEINDSTAEEETNRRLVITPGSAITAHRIEWWEQDLVVKGAVNLIAAREGQGKSTVAASWAARETRDGGTVLWIGTEESRSHAQVPRLIAAGADMDRVLFIDLEVIEGTKGMPGSLRFPLDLPLIEKAISDQNVTLIVLDPCKGTVSQDFQGNDDVAVRRFLEPIADTCHRCDVTLLGLVHFGKRESQDPGKLILGSVAWSQVARSVISIAEDPDTGSRVLTNGKCNYSPHPRSIEFRIVPEVIETAEGPSEFGTVEWIGDTNKDARDLLGESRREGGDEFDEHDYTADLKASWLYRYLSDAQAVNELVRPKDAVALGADKNISRRSVFRTFDKLANAGMAESIDGPGFPRVTFWRLVCGDTTGTAGPDAESSGTTGTTGPDQAKDDDTTAPLWEDGETTGDTTVKTGSEQAKQDAQQDVDPPVVPVVPRPAHDTPAEPPGGITNRTPGMTDRVVAVLAKTSQQTHLASVSAG